MIETTDAALRAKVNGLEKQIDERLTKLNKRVDEIYSLPIAFLLGSKANDKRKELESERDKLRERNALLEARISNAGAGTAQVVERNRRLEVVVADLRAQLSAAEATSRDIKQERDELDDLRTVLIKERDELRTKLAEAQEQAYLYTEAKRALEAERDEAVAISDMLRKERLDLSRRCEELLDRLKRADDFCASVLLERDELRKRSHLVGRPEAGERVYREVAKKAEKRAADAESERDELKRRLDELVKGRDDFLKRVEQRLDLLLNQARSEAEKKRDELKCEALGHAEEEESSEPNRVNVLALIREMRELKQNRNLWKERAAALGDALRKAEKRAVAEKSHEAEAAEEESSEPQQDPTSMGGGRTWHKP